MKAETLPEEIIIEIFKHCRGVNWSYRELALLCRICKAWQPTAQRALYRDLRVDHRSEVGKLVTVLQHTPENASLVQSIVINGDGAHAAHIYSLLKLTDALKHILFFDFELSSSLQQEALFYALPMHSLTSLAFSVLPPDFVVAALKACCHCVVSLRVYRVDLGSIAAEEWLDGETTSPDSTAKLWQFPNLRVLSLWYIGDISAEVLQILVIQHSRQLRSLKLRFDRPGAMCKSAEAWKGCRLDRLEHLELGNFMTDTTFVILRDALDENLYLNMLRLPGLRSTKVLPVDGSTPAPMDSGYSHTRGLLAYIPKTVEHLDFSDCKDEEICSKLPERLNSVRQWLPNLKSCPRITIGQNAIPREQVPLLKESFLLAARRAGLTMYQDSQYYAVEGFWHGN